MGKPSDVTVPNGAAWLMKQTMRSCTALEGQEKQRQLIPKKNKERITSADVA
jgi:hypothetical protein